MKKHTILFLAANPTGDLPWLLTGGTEGDAFVAAACQAALHTMDLRERQRG